MHINCLFPIYLKVAKARVPWVILFCRFSMLAKLQLPYALLQYTLAFVN